MSRLIMCKGLPGSGKSTWAKTQVHLDPNHVVRVNKDSIRLGLNKPWSRELEVEVVAIRDQRIRDYVDSGFETIIVDDTNLAPKHERVLENLARDLHIHFEINDSFVNVPITTCVQRDLQREGNEQVGEKVIRGMAEEFLKGILPSLVERNHEPQLFLDLDGCLADFDGFIEKEFGIENNRENERPDFWDIVRKYPGRLYYDMKPLPDAKELYEGLRRFEPIILTGCPWSIPNAAQDKRDWVREHVDPTVKVETCKSRSKRLYGRSGDLLVDDWNKYQDLWESMGGVFILHKPGQTQSTIERVEGYLDSV